MITTGGDNLTKIMRYISKTVTNAFDGHASNVSFAIYQLMLLIIVIRCGWEVEITMEGVGLVLWSSKRGWDEPACSMNPLGKIAYTAIARYLHPLFKLPRRT